MTTAAPPKPRASFKLWSLDGFSLFGMPPVPSVLACAATGIFIACWTYDHMPRPVDPCRAERVALDQLRTTMQLPDTLLLTSDPFRALESCISRERESRTPVS